MEAPAFSKSATPHRYCSPSPHLPDPNIHPQNFPEHQYPSIVGRPILRSEERDGQDFILKDIMCGDEAAAARSMLQITYPVRRPSLPHNPSHH